MYTQCPKCETVFKMSAEVLRTAGGQVRCGHCGEVFNALARLAEDASAFSTAESPLEMEARADRILHSPPATPSTPKSLVPEQEEDPETLEAADVEFAQLQIIDVPSETLEFSLPPTELDRVFVEPTTKGKGAETAKPGGAGGIAGAGPAGGALARSTPAPPSESVPVHGRAPASGRVPPRAPGGAPRPGAAPSGAAPSGAAPSGAAPSGAARRGAAASPTAPMGPGARGPSASPPPAQRAPRSGTAARAAGTSTNASTNASASASANASTGAGAFSTRAAGTSLEPPVEEADIDLEDTLPPHPESRAAQSARELDQRSASGGFVSEEVRSAMLAGLDGAALPALEPVRARPPGFLLWFGAALALAALLAAQMFLANRAWFAKNWGVGGATLPNLSAYQQQVWGVTGEPGASGTLRVRASLMNVSALLQPYPLLRITLTDRFGNRIGSRDFAPTEYLGKPMVRMLAPGERVDATLDIQDPGKEAEGYELDVCLRAGERVICAADAAPQSAK